MSDSLTFTVPGMSCAHCTQAVERELRLVDGVEEAHADLESKQVRVAGNDLRKDALRAAIAEAGYEAA